MKEITFNTNNDNKLKRKSKTNIILIRMPWIRKVHNIMTKHSYMDQIDMSWYQGINSIHMIVEDLILYKLTNATYDGVENDLIYSRVRNMDYDFEKEECNLIDSVIYDINVELVNTFENVYGLRVSNYGLLTWLGDEVALLEMIFNSATKE